MTSQIYYLSFQKPAKPVSGVLRQRICECYRSDLLSLLVDNPQDAVEAKRFTAEQAVGHDFARRHNRFRLGRGRICEIATILVNERLIAGVNVEEKTRHAVGHLFSAVLRSARGSGSHLRKQAATGDENENR